MALNVVPVAGQTLNASQPLIAANFANIDTGFAIEHVAFNLGGQGKHKTATFPAAAAPGAVAATEVGLYAATYGTGPELYINKTGSQIPFTYYKQNAKGYTILPSGLYIQWASGTVAAHSLTTTVTLDVAFPGDILCCQVSTTSDIGTESRDYILSARKVTTQTIKVTRGVGHDTNTVTFNLLVIGY